MKKYLFMLILIGLIGCKDETATFNNSLSKQELSSIQTMRYVSPEGYTKEELKKAWKEVSIFGGELGDVIAQGKDIASVDQKTRSILSQFTGASKSYAAQTASWQILNYELKQPNPNLERIRYYTALLIQNESNEYATIVPALQKLEGNTATNILATLGKKALDSYSTSNCEKCDTSDLAEVDRKYEQNREEAFNDLKQLQKKIDIANH